MWSGDADGAKKQFAAAAALFLTSGERATLARLGERAWLRKATRRRPARSGTALRTSLALAGASRAKADAYLDRQGRLADLQAQNLIEQNAFELSHLRFRRFSDWAKFALELSVALVVLLLVCGLGTMVWNAAHDRDLVVDAFSVPPDIAQSGMTGNVLAARLLDRFGAMDAGILTFSEDFSGYHGRADEVRVEIPSTGVSIGEVDRLLRAWLGHETHVSGELVHTAKGLAVTVRYDGRPGVTAEGPADGLDALIQTSAENMFAAVRPLRFADYLSSHNRMPEALAILRRETRDRRRGPSRRRLYQLDHARFPEGRQRRHGRPQRGGARAGSGQYRGPLRPRRGGEQCRPQRGALCRDEGFSRRRGSRGEWRDRSGRRRGDRHIDARGSHGRSGRRARRDRDVPANGRPGSRHLRCDRTWISVRRHPRRRAGAARPRPGVARRQHGQAELRRGRMRAPMSRLRPAISRRRSRWPPRRTRSARRIRTKDWIARYSSFPCGPRRWRGAAGSPTRGR